MRIPPHDLTFVAERLGARQPAQLGYLRTLARHASPIVREGVVYSMAKAGARADLERVANTDEEALIRSIAAEALE
ncbi:MAG TPA: hypothetical protein VFQ42_22215 [Mycobacterium sp.]|nr:hypothetical protein [Mycobacterium sp.]